MKPKKVNVDGLARLPAFCHAVIAGDFIYVSGTLGVKPNSVGGSPALELVEGGTGPETTQTLRHIETILKACGASLDDVVKVNVFLADMDTFAEMNEAYLGIMGSDPPARITVGRAALALGAAVEIDCIAYKPQISKALCATICKRLSCAAFSSFSPDRPNHLIRKDQKHEIHRDPAPIS
jgi:2-iminobutanoate/2-iminopropanoate deaminase